LNECCVQVSKSGRIVVIFDLHIENYLDDFWAVGEALSIMSSASMPFRNIGQPIRTRSTDPYNDIDIRTEHYIGIDVGTGSARACIVDAKGDIVGLASENIGLWQPKHGWYVSGDATASRKYENANWWSRSNLPRISGDVSATRSRRQWPTVRQTPRPSEA
jgi:hypothetical protein